MDDAVIACPGGGGGGAGGGGGEHLWLDSLTENLGAVVLELTPGEAAWLITTSDRCLTCIVC